MNNSLIGLKRADNALPTNGQVPIYDESLGVYKPGDVSGGGSATIYPEKLLTEGNITAGFKDMVVPFPQWTKESNNAGYTGLVWSKVIQYNNMYYLYSISSEVYTSNDCKLWTLASNNGGFVGGMYGFCVEVFLNAVYILNTNDGSLWKSTDGVSFSRVTTTGYPPSGHVFAASCIFLNKIWLLGGGADTGDVYNSDDGINWSSITTGSKWGGRRRISAIVHNAELYVMFGTTSFTPYNDVWKTSNGIDWTLVATGVLNPLQAPGNAVASKYGKLWIVGGMTQNDGWTGKMYHSSDNGVTWVNLTTGIDARSGHCLVDNDAELVAIGGQNAYGPFTDVWTNPVNIATVTLDPLKTQVHLLTGIIISANDIWIRTTSKLAYFYDSVIRQWALLSEYTTLFEVETEPASGMVDGDVWIQTSTQNLYVYEVDTWTPKYSAITSYLQESRPVERSIQPLRNQARSHDGNGDFVADGSRIYFNNTDGKTNLSGKPAVDDVLIVEQL